MTDENKIFDEAFINKPDDLYRHIEIFETIPEDDWAYTIKLNSWDYSRSSLRRKREAGEDLKKIFKQAKRCAFKLRKQNTNLPSLKDVKDFDELKEWCIVAQKADTENKEPLTKDARIIYEKLSSLKEHEAMTRKEILDWLASEHSNFMDEGTFSKKVKELLPYGLKNKPRIGYFLRK